MASRSVHIANFADAVGSGAIPGGFNPARTVFAFPTLETPTQSGGKNVWTVSVRALDAAGRPRPIRDDWLAPRAAAPGGVVGEVSTESHNVSAAGVRGAARRGGVPTIVREGKNAGKANATNPVTQALRDALGLYNAKLRKAAAPKAADPDSAAAPKAADPDSAAAPKAADADAPKNGAPPVRPPPMLVKRFGETRGATLGPAEFARGVTLQPKLNGVRLVAYEDGAGVRLYSRRSENYPGLAAIRAQAARLLAGAEAGAAELAAEGAADLRGAAPHLDGELYLHGKSLNWISGQARREDDDGSLQFHVFDVFFPGRPEAPSRDRQAYLDALFAREGPLGNIRRVPGEPVESEARMRARVDAFVAEGYEGGIARKDWETYRYGTNNYHSDHLVKVKPIFHDEFPVVGFAQGSRGKDVGAVIWVCDVPAAERAPPGAAGDFTFNVVPKDMSYARRRAIFECLSGEGGRRLFDLHVKGQPLTVEYPERSAKTGKPSQAKALAFRTYEGGPGSDPIARLFRECGAGGE